MKWQIYFCDICLFVFVTPSQTLPPLSGESGKGKEQNVGRVKGKWKTGNLVNSFETKLTTEALTNPVPRSLMQVESKWCFESFQF